MLTFFLLWIAASGSITAAACISIARFQRRPGLLSNPRYYPEEQFSSVIQYPQASPPRVKEVDEYLKNGEPMNPPEFVADGTHPTVAARQRTRIEGVRYSTRRVIKEVQ